MSESNVERELREVFRDDISKIKTTVEGILKQVTENQVHHEYTERKIIELEGIQKKQGESLDEYLLRVGQLKYVMSGVLILFNGLMFLAFKYLLFKGGP